LLWLGQTQEDIMLALFIVSLIAMAEFAAALSDSFPLYALDAEIAVETGIR
jgi:hypothetical protein